MDVPSIVNLFATSLNPDPNVRKVSEIEIRRIGNLEGVLTALMQIIGNESVDPAVRQATAVFLKNRIERSWNTESSRLRPDSSPIPDSDRIFIKSHILPLLVAASARPLRLQIAAAMKTIITYDFPDQWPNLLDEIIALLHGDEKSIYGGSFALLELVKSARFRIENNYMPTIAEKAFPTLVTLGTSLVASLTPSNAELLHIILKTYKASTQTSLSPHQQSSESIMAWGRLLFAVVNVQLPASTPTLPGTPEDWQTSEWWKAKKWAFNTLNRLFERYGNPSQLPASMKAEVSAFAEHFVKSFAPEIFKTYLQQVEMHASGQIWLSKKVLSAILRFFSACVKPKSTWTLVKPQVENLISKVVFPTLVFDEGRAELWQTDPVEFARLTIEMDDLVSPPAAGLSFLLQLATSRPKSTFMPTLAFINSVVSSPTATPQDKFGALSMIAALGGVIMESKSVKGEMEGFVTKFVIPELASQQGYMRQVALDVIATFERFGMEWKNPANLEAAYHAVVRTVEDPELPVRVSSVLALMHMIDHDEVRQGLSGHVVQIMQVLFTLSDETDMDVISEAMETFIDKFKAELVPASVEIVGRLCQNYMRLVQEHIAPGASEEVTPTSVLEDDKTMAMMGLTKTIEAVVDALETVEPKPLEVLAHVQEIVLPIIVFTLEHKVIDLFDSVFSLVDIFTFTLRTISPSMWPVFENMYKLFKSDAADYLEEMLPSLDNFIDFGKDVFASRPDYRSMAVDFYTTGLTGSVISGDQDRVNACALGEAILLNLRGQIDDALPTIIASAATVFGKPSKAPTLKLAIMNVLLNTLLYNPILALQIMESQHSGLARALFDEWFVALKSEGAKDLPRVHDKRLSLVTLSTLMELTPDNIPGALRDGWPGLIAAELNVFSKFQDALAKRQELIATAEDDFIEDDDELEDLLANKSMEDNDDEDVWDEDDEYLAMIAAEGARLRASKRGESLDVASDGADDDDDEEDDDDIDEELNVETPLDSIDPYIRFKAALAVFQNANPAGYQAATTSLSVEQQTQLMEVMALAQKAEETAAAV